MKFDLSCPIEIRDLKINRENGTVEASFFNLSSKTITAIKYILVLSDENGEETGRIPAELEGISLAMHESYDAVISAENAENADIIFSEFTFDDGNIFTPSGNLTEVEISELTDEEKARFDRAAAFDAVCYSKETPSYWLCICGRPNIPGAETCVRCGREKETVLRDFSSEQALAAAIIKKEELDAQHAKEQAEIEAQRKAAQRAEIIAKSKKYGKVAAIAIVVILVIVFGFKFITLKLGDSAAAKGDYVKAASMYDLSGSAKYDEIAQKLYGNTSTNLMQMGIMTEDDKNVYYLDTMLNIFRKDKETGEQTAMGEANGKYLNASGGWLYYLNNADSNKIYRISPDGATNECVYDGSAYYLFTAGNDIYFIGDEVKAEEEKTEATDAPEADGAEAEAAPTDSAEETSEPIYPLFVLRDDEKEPEKLSESNIAAFTVYKDKIYYIDFDDNYSVYAMSLEGKGAKKIINGPVYSLEVVNDRIYYTDGAVDETAQNAMPSLALVSAKLNGSGKTNVIDNAMVTTFALSGDNLYYTDYNQQGTLFKKIADSEPVVEADSVYIINVHGDYVYYLSFSGDMNLSKPDGSGYEIVARANAAEETPAEEAPAEEAPAEEAPAEVPAE